MASPVLALGSQGGDAGSSPNVVGSQTGGFPHPPQHVRALPVGKSRIRSCARVYCCLQPGPSSSQHPAEGGRKSCSPATTSQSAMAVASMEKPVSISDIKGGTMMSLPAGIRRPGEVSLTFPYPPVMGDNPPRELPVPRALRRGPRGTPVGWSHVLPTTSPSGCRQWGAEQPNSLHPSEGSLQRSPGLESSGLGKASESEAVL